MSYAGQDNELQSVIASIADQLCDTVDNRFDMHVTVDSDDVQGQSADEEVLSNEEADVGHGEAVEEVARPHLVSSE